MKKRGKKGIELSVNFFVVMVLSVVILGFGLKLLYDMLAKANNVVDNNPAFGSCTDQQIDSMLAGSRVVVCPSGLQIPRAKSGTFMTGIMNSDVPDSNSPASDKFLVSVTAAAGVGRDGSIISDANLLGFKFGYMPKYVIKPNTNKKLIVSATVPSNALSGTYAVDVLVCSGTSTPESCTNANSYDAVQKVYITVP